jgi:tetratricopeptide (TPR) repeat protein
LSHPLTNWLYLIIPLSIALAASLVVAVIAARKMSYLRKLTPESHEVGDTIVHDFAPEAVDWFRGIPWQQYRQRFLGNVEGILAHFRRISFALGKASDSVIRSVRRAGQQAGKEHEEAVAQRVAEKEEKKREEERDLDEVDMDDPDQLRSEEQRLIVAIAQDPKDHELYSDLAKVYMRLRHYGDAVEALEQVVRLKPGEEQYLKRLERAKRKKEEAAAQGERIS